MRVKCHVLVWLWHELVLLVSDDGFCLMLRRNMITASHRIEVNKIPLWRIFTSVSTLNLLSPTIEHYNKKREIWGARRWLIWQKLRLSYTKMSNFSEFSLIVLSLRLLQMKDNINTNFWLLTSCHMLHVYRCKKFKVLCFMGLCALEWGCL